MNTSTMTAAGTIQQTAEEKALSAMLADKNIPDSMKQFLAAQHKELARLKKAEADAQAELAKKDAQKSAPYIVDIKEPSISKNGKNIPAQVEFKSKTKMPWFIASTEKPTSYWRELLDPVVIESIRAACDEADRLYPAPIVTADK